MSPKANDNIDERLARIDHLIELFQVEHEDLRAYRRLVGRDIRHRLKSEQNLTLVRNRPRSRHR
jgi:hypothetical protein